MCIGKSTAMFITKLPKVILLCVIIYLISLNFKEGDRNQEARPETVFKVVSLDAVRKYFPACTSIEQQSEVRYDVKENGRVVGMLIVTTPVADDLIGYAGNVPLFLAVSKEDVILGLTLLDHGESPGFIARLERGNLLSAWNGKTLEEAALLEVDAISGATMSSDAIRGSVKKALCFYLERDGGGVQQDGLQVVRSVSGGIVILLALVSMFWGAKMKRWRFVLQVSSVLILGFWSGYFISFELLFSWLLNGIPWGARVLLATIAVLGVACPLFLNKAYYCAYVCPFGAAQELAGRVRKKKVVLGGGARMVLKYTRWVYFMVVIALLLWGVPLDLASLEPFPAFLLTAATGGMIALGVVFLLLSIFFSRPWCNYFCPTGQFLDILRKGDTVAAVGGKKKIIGEYVALAVFLVILFFILR